MNDRLVRFAALQTALPGPLEVNVARVEALVRQAAEQGAQVIVPSELFEGPYFPREQREDAFALAHPLDGHPTIARMSNVARELEVVIPVSFFERSAQAYYNSVAMIDADGRVLGVYRKSHIPDGPGYQEKFYFAPGDTGFRVWETRWGTFGVGICWDQWYPEAARAMVLMGAEALLYPTAIGSEPLDPDLDTSVPWRLAMRGHAVSNVVPVVAANRVGEEGALSFYGASFIAAPLGEVVAEAGGDVDAVVMAAVDLEDAARVRASWGFFRDRRPDLYGALLTRDGRPPEEG